MKRLTTLAALAAGLLTSGAAAAAEQTVKLAVSNMYCSACPSLVRKALTQPLGTATMNAKQAGLLASSLAIA